MSPDECVERFGSFAMSRIGSWSRWGSREDFEQAAMVGLLEACDAADWAAIECGDGRDGHSSAVLFMAFARPYIVNEFRLMAALAAPVSGLGRNWTDADGLPVGVMFDESVDVASPVESGDADILADLWAAASGLDTRSESVLLGTYMLEHTDEFMAEFFGVSERHVERLRAAAIEEVRLRYAD